MSLRPPTASRVGWSASPPTSTRSASSAAPTLAKDGSRLANLRAVQRLLTTLNRLLVRFLLKPFLGPPWPIGLRRRWLSLAAKTMGGARDVERSEIQLGELPTLRLRPAGSAPVGLAMPAERPAILYVHGGAFLLGGAGSHGGLASRIAAATGADVYLPEYRLAPEHPHPAPDDDLFAAYVAMLDLGHRPERVAIAGDSAGGALATSLALTLPEMGVPGPAALVLLSPWLDLSLSGASVAANAPIDPMLKRSFLDEGARAHAGALHRDDPRVSPLFADLRGLPPTLVQVGSDEILLDDSTRFADRADAAGVAVELQRFEGLWHDFQTEAGMLAAARGAIDDIAGFIARRSAAAEPAPPGA